ncbi:MAG: adenylate/guanylate cyclase domain-containing protein [Solirubrobacterales bacterium]
MGTDGKSEGNGEVAAEPDSGRMVDVIRKVRERLPGDSDFGDTLSTTGDETAQRVAAKVGQMADHRPSALREMGLTALQVWQAIGQASDRRGDEPLTIMFTDLVGFSEWALEAGDKRAIQLLRAVGDALEPCVRGHGGTVVKRLGDGIMAVFDDPADAVAAAFDARDHVADVEVDGHRPHLRMGLHLGRPRRLGDDYLGIDVNIAARVAECARGGEVMLSNPTLAELDGDALVIDRRRRITPKGTPEGLAIYVVDPA